MIKNPKPGQKVRINDQGMDMIGGIRSHVEYQKYLSLTIKRANPVWGIPDLWDLEFEEDVPFLISSDDVDPTE